MLAILRVCVEGLEAVFNSGRCTSAGAGGLASAMFLFEIAMTHYYEKAVTIPNNRNTKIRPGSKSSNISRANSPKHMNSRNSSARSGSISTNSSDTSTLGGNLTSNLSNAKVISLNDIQTSVSNKISSLSSAFGNFLGSFR